MNDAEKIRKVLEKAIPLRDALRTVWPCSEIVRITLHTNDAVLNGRDSGPTKENTEENKESR